jgi:hypothetical protein
VADLYADVLRCGELSQRSIESGHYDTGRISDKHQLSLIRPP